MRRLAAAVVAALVLTVPAGCFDQEPPADVEIEDCDAEDRRNREAECGFVGSGVRSGGDAHRDRPAKPVTKPKPK